MRRLLVSVGLTLLLGLGALAPAAAASPLDVSYHQWSTPADLASGSIDGSSLVVTAGGLQLGPAPVYGHDHKRWYDGHDYEAGSWTSPWFSPGFAFQELVSSWNADTPSGTWIQVEMQETVSDTYAADKTSGWWVMGVWASGDDTIERTSVNHQFSWFGAVYTDTFKTRRATLAYRLRVTLFRVPGSGVTPTLRQVGAMTSTATYHRRPIPSPYTGGPEGISLPRPFPAYSQEIHRGELRRFDGGGEAWCSPTSTEMVVEYWGRYPSDLSWVDPSFPDPSVDYAARGTFDYAYHGTGNWPFNVAYAASYPGLVGEVTRLRSLSEAEQFLEAGIPLVVSVSFGPHQLHGFLFGSTDGHLLTIVGFTPSGDVISYDPAATSDATVPHVYDRAEFEKVWTESKPSGGLTYIIHPADVPLPPTPPGLTPNW